MVTRIQVSASDTLRAYLLTLLLALHRVSPASELSDLMRYPTKRHPSITEIKMDRIERDTRVVLSTVVASILGSVSDSNLVDEVMFSCMSLSSMMLETRALTEMTTSVLPMKSVLVCMIFESMTMSRTTTEAMEQG